MASRCLYERLLANDFIQFRLRQIPRGARWTWLMLAKAMAVADEIGTLRFGSDLGLSALVSALVSISETEAETDLETLIGVGLLVERSDGALALPVIAGHSSKRAEAARNNGKLGGRPRKDGYPPRQREMLLPLKGGSPEKPNETERVSDGTTTTTRKLVTPETQDDWHRVAARVADAAGLDMVRGAHTLGIVRVWLDLGATEALILDVVRSKVRPGIHSLGYFDKPIRALMQANPVEPTYDPAEEAVRQQWRAAVAAWREGGAGPAPDLQEYLARARPAA